MGDFSGGRDKWVCPNDRELALRAKLRTGWSVKTGTVSTFVKSEQLNDAEQAMIVNVIRRADMLEHLEQERVGRLVERVENMKKNALGNGSTQCILCADEFGLLSASPLLCNDCRKAVCTKCGVDTFSAHKEQIWLCKICSETREMWKKSGAWFYGSMPKYTVPEKKVISTKYGIGKSKPADSNPISGRGWYRGQSEKESTDSSDDDMKLCRINRKYISRKAMYDSTESSDSSASPRLPPVNQEAPNTPRDTGSANQVFSHYPTPSIESLDSDKLPLGDGATASYQPHPDYGESADHVAPPGVAPWIHRQWKHGNVERNYDAEDDEEEEEGMNSQYCHRQDSQQSIGSTSSGGGSRHPGPHQRFHRDVTLENASFEEKSSPDDTSKKKTKSFMRKIRRTMKSRR